MRLFFVAILAFVASGCTAQHCTTERAIVDAVGAGITAADETLGDDVSEDTQTALTIAGGVSDLGAAAVDACDMLQAGAGWQQWVGLALEAAMRLLGRFMSTSGGAVGVAENPAAILRAAEEAPPELVRAVQMLQAAQ